MRAPAYVLDAGDVVCPEFDSQAGSEQSSHHPAGVLSPVELAEARAKLRALMR